MDKLPADFIAPVGPDWPKPISLVLLDTLPWALLKRPVLLVATARWPGLALLLLALGLR